MAMESTPVSGVAIKNEETAPLLAPCSFKPAAAGNTPQLHKGKGMPIKADLKTLADFPLPKCLPTISSGKNAFNRPATTNPKIIKGEESNKTCHADVKT